MVPQHGHGAVGEAARTVMVTSVVIRTCSITRSERSGMMVIGSHWIWKTSRRRTCLVLQYTTCAISGPAEEPGYVSFGQDMGHIVRQRPSEAKFALMKSLSLRTTRRKHLPSRAAPPPILIICMRLSRLPVGRIAAL